MYDGHTLYAITSKDDQKSDIPESLRINDNKEDEISKDNEGLGKEKDGQSDDFITSDKHSNNSKKAEITQSMSIPFNYSHTWLTTKRRNNWNEPLMTHEWVYNYILCNSPFSNGSKDILRQTMAYEESDFVSWRNSSDIEKMAHRLVFLAIHQHQHKPARAEALARKSGIFNETLLTHKVGPYDYQCDPDTKYLVYDFFVGGMGFAASARNIINMYIAAISSGRVLATFKHKRGNKLVSCKRGDMQCNFLPDTPCIMTTDELLNKTKIELDQFKALIANGTINEELDSTRVLYFENPEQAVYGKTTPHVRNRVIEIIKQILEADMKMGGINQDNPWNISDFELMETYKLIRSDDWLISQTIWGYLIRPNLDTRKKIETTVKLLTKDIKAESTMGLAIRASDKCFQETKCMKIENYMELMKEMSRKRTNIRSDANEAESILYDTIILTTEDRNVIEEYKNFTLKNESFPFGVVINKDDIMQGAGDPKKFKGNQEKVMISSLVAVKLHMFSDTVIINGCSNFHRNIIYHMRKMGFSKAKNSYVETLNQNDNPKYRMKCGNSIYNF